MHKWLKMSVMFLLDVTVLTQKVVWSSEQPGLAEDVPAHGRGVGTR